MKKIVLIPCALLTLSTSVFAARWDKVNNPNNFVFVTKKAFNYQLMSLPLEAKLSNSHFIWSDTYWPSMLGGIAYRWNAEPNPMPFKYKLKTVAELKRMDLAELETLSPTEKYDIYMGKTDSKGEIKYELTTKILSMYSPEELWWEGICHGWAMAAVNHPEPARRDDLENKKIGVRVPFGSSDVKALLDFFYANVQTTGAYGRIGARCGVEGKVPGEGTSNDTNVSMPSLRDRNSEKCADTNAGAFHVAITNMVGLQDRGFIAEVDRFNDVWNQPVGQYKSEIMEYTDPNPAQKKDGVHKLVRVKTIMTYGDELNLLSDRGVEGIEGGFMSMDPVTGTPDQTFAEKDYEYVLEVDLRGNVIGGEWISETRPDFIWLKEKSTNFAIGKAGYDFSGLNTIYKAVTDK